MRRAREGRVEEKKEKEERREWLAHFVCLSLIRDLMSFEVTVMKDNEKKGLGSN